jgi:hypothetical protein
MWSVGFFDGVVDAFDGTSGSFFFFLVLPVRGGL